MNKKVSITITSEVIDKMSDMPDAEIAEMVFEMYNYAVINASKQQSTYAIDLNKFGEIERTKF